MKKIIGFFILLFLVNCAKPLPRCEGTKDDIFQCKVLRNQEKQRRMMILYSPD